MKQDRLLCAGVFRLNVPPGYDRYMEWGFSDGSVRFYAAESKKVWRAIVQTLQPVADPLPLASGAL
jgi:hypothetical protein